MILRSDDEYGGRQQRSYTESHWHAPRTVRLVMAVWADLQVFGKEPHANARPGADAVAHDCVGHWQQRVGGRVRARARHARPSDPGHRDRRVAVCQGRAGRVRPRLVRGLCDAQGSTRGVRIARRRPRVAGQHRARRPLGGHGRRRGHARGGGALRSVARRRGRPQSSRMAEGVRRQGRRSRRAHRHRRRPDARGRRRAGVARRSVSRQGRRPVEAVAGSVHQGDRSHQPDVLGARPAASRRVNRCGRRTPWMRRGSAGRIACFPIRA